MKNPLPRIETAVRNLDTLLHGGLPRASVSGGSPGAGKTILAQEIGFHHASAKQCVVWFGLEVYKLRNTPTRWDVTP